MREQANQRGVDVESSRDKDEELDQLQALSSANELGVEREQEEGTEIPHANESELIAATERRTGQAAGMPQKQAPKTKTTALDRIRKFERMLDKSPTWKLAELTMLLQLKGPQGLIVEIEKRQPEQAIELLARPPAAQQLGLAKPPMFGGARGAWGEIVGQLARSKLDPACTKSLDGLVERGALDLEDMKAMFAARFGHPATDVTDKWTASTLRTTWSQLAVLPARDVTLNNMISTFQAIDGTWGFYHGKTIKLGQDVDGERLEHTVRHEIGHAVHAKIGEAVDPWLRQDMQFQAMRWDGWIEELGGYPKDFVDSHGNRVPFDAAWRTRIEAMLESFAGSNFSPNRAAVDTGQTPDARLAWAAMPAKVKNAVGQSKTNYYENYENFQQQGGKRYFVAHANGGNPFAMGAPAYQTVKATGEPYTASTQNEFFANCYAEYFENPAGVRDPSKWGGSLPDPVKTFFKTCVVQRHPYSKFDDLTPGGHDHTKKQTE